METSSSPPESPAHKDSEEVKKEEKPEQQFSLEDFLNAVRYGSRTHVAFILQHDSSLVHQIDSQGYSCMHWAAKRGDYEVLCQLQESGAHLNTPASFDTQMRPIHWAASDGKLKSIKFLLDHRQDINAQDGNGCSPVIIAAQYGRVETVIYLVKNGADLNQRDVNGDTALHWAAYKGFDEVAGVLMHFSPQFKDLPDNYGQTPLHLAALRGNFEVVEFLISEFSASTSIRDKNGCTPLMLTVKKEQLRTEWVLRRLTSSNTLDLITNLGLSRLRNKQILAYLFIGCGDAEVSRWIWRLSFTSNFIATYITIGYTSSSVLADHSTLHMVNTVFQFIWWILFLLCLYKSPGFVPDEAAGINRPPVSTRPPYEKNTIQGYHPHSYDAALVLMGSDMALEEATAVKLPPVCHTCRVQKPLRSKHCKVLRKCVCKFDHFCPFIYNTVGRDNYKYFVSILVWHPLAYLLFLYSTICYWYRAPLTWTFVFFLLYSFAMFVGISGLCMYHLKLIGKNMTTNEEINMFRYTYFKNEFLMQDNPFCRGSQLGNFLDGMFPSSKLYYTREEVKRDALNSPDGSAAEDEGFFEESRSKLLA